MSDRQSDSIEKELNSNNTELIATHLCKIRVKALAEGYNPVATSIVESIRDGIRTPLKRPSAISDQGESDSFASTKRHAEASMTTVPNEDPQATLTVDVVDADTAPALLGQGLNAQGTSALEAGQQSRVNQIYAVDSSFNNPYHSQHTTGTLRVKVGDEPPPTSNMRLVIVYSYLGHG